MGPRRRTASALAVLLAMLAGAPAAPAAEPAGELRFFSEIDGKCHNLSEGGKMRRMENTHPSRPIRYRLTRYFAGKPQPGRAMGVIAPGEEAIKLGCTLVQGREQTWQVERAEYGG